MFNRIHTFSGQGLLKDLGPYKQHQHYALRYF